MKFGISCFAQHFHYCVPAKSGWLHPLQITLQKKKSFGVKMCCNKSWASHFCARKQKQKQRQPAFGQQMEGVQAACKWQRHVKAAAKAKAAANKSRPLNVHAGGLPEDYSDQGPEAIERDESRAP